MKEETRVASFLFAPTLPSLLRFQRRRSVAATAGRSVPRGFTLAELLTVLAITSLLLAATVPALEGLTTSARHTAALRLLSGLLEEARSLAIAEHAVVYLVFTHASPERPHPSLALYREPDSATGLPKAISPWHPLPGNTTFYSATRKNSPSSLFNAPATVQPPQSFPLTGSDTPQELPYLAFGPTGEVIAPAESRFARIILARHTAHDANAPIASLEAFNLSLFTGRATFETLPLPPPRKKPR